VLLQQARQRVHDLGAAVAAHGDPARLRAARGFDGAVDVGWVACVTCASSLPSAGLTEAKVSAASVHAPSMNRPKRRPCWSSHACASLVLSGAGP
jgi:hypothetical protein